VVAVYWGTGVAGSGKTTRILERLEGGTEETLALTFSRRAADRLEARWLALREERLRRGEPLPDQSVRFLTYQRLATYLLQRAGVPVSAAPLDDLEGRVLVGDLLDRLQAPRLEGLEERAARRIWTSAALRDDLLALFLALKQYRVDAPGFQALMGSLEGDPLGQGAALAFARYEAELTQLGALDFRGITRQALEAASGLVPAPVRLLLDDAQDVDPLQLETLARFGAAGQLWCYADPRQSIYRFRGAVAEPQTLLRRYLPGARWEEPARDGRTFRLPNGVARVASRFPMDSAEPLQSQISTEEAGGVDYWVCATPAAELEQLAERLIDAFSGGATVRDPQTRQRRPLRPEDVAVIGRSFTEVRAAAEALSARGLPVNTLSGGAILIARALEEGLRLLAYEDRYRAGGGGGDVDAREARGEANAAAAHLARIGSEAPDTALQVSRVMRRAGNREYLLAHPTLAALRSLRTALDEARARLSAGDPGRALLRLAEVARAPQVLSGAELDGAMQVLGEALTRVDRLRRVLCPGGEAVSAARLGELLPELLLLDRVESRPGSLAVIPAHEAKGQEWPWVVLLSLNEGTFPAPVRLTRLFQPETLARLRELMAQASGLDERDLALGAFAEEFGDAVSEEERLFHVCLTRATERLILSCHTHSGGAPVSPSRFLLRAYPEDLEVATAAERKAASFRCVLQDHLPQREGGRASCTGCPVDPCHGRQTPLLTAAQVEIRTRVTPPPPAWPAVVSSERVLSPSELRACSACPRRFFLERMLRLGEAEGDALVFGNALHTALEGLALLPDGERTRERLLALSREALEQTSGWSSAAARALRLRPLPRLLENCWGDGPSYQIIGAPEQRLTLELRDSTGAFHRFAGRMDLPASDPSGAGVVDYKTGRPISALDLRRRMYVRPGETNSKGKVLEQGEQDFQLPLYALAAGGEVTWMLHHYLHPSVKAGKAEVRVTLGEPAGDAQLTPAELAEIGLAAANLAGWIKRCGYFPPGEDCGGEQGCPFPGLCGTGGAA